jgi:hypothetical protein
MHTHRAATSAQEFVPRIFQEIMKELEVFTARGGALISRLELL